MKYKDLLIELVKREIKARYKQSILGYAWVILVPLLNLLVLSVVFSYFIRIPTGGTPYVIFLFTGLVPWTFTANSISFATQSVIANTSLITKIYLPREVFPIATILAKMVDFLLTCLVLVALLIIFGVSFKLTMLFVPVIFFFHFLLVVGISLFLSALNVFFRDVENVIGVLLTIWMYITPILYPQELIPPAFVPFFNLNPMMPIINAYRNTILYGMMPSWQSFAYAIGVSTLTFVLGYRFFKSKSRYFADVI
jgi:ABC-2 type transport system permease protein